MHLSLYRGYSDTSEWIWLRIISYRYFYLRILVVVCVFEMFCDVWCLGKTKEDEKLKLGTDEG